MTIIRDDQAQAQLCLQQEIQITQACLLQYQPLQRLSVGSIALWGLLATMAWQLGYHALWANLGYWLWFLLFQYHMIRIRLDVSLWDAALQSPDISLFLQQIDACFGIKHAPTVTERRRGCFRFMKWLAVCLGFQILCLLGLLFLII